VNTAESVQALFETADKNGVTINRVTETYGMFATRVRNSRSTAASATSMVQSCCFRWGRALRMTRGNRLSPQGVRISYRLRGMEQVLRGIEDIKRGYELGCRGFVIYDEGMLWVISEMRKDGALPKDITFKASAHLGHCNPASVKVLESLGADSINPVRDLQIQCWLPFAPPSKFPRHSHGQPSGVGRFHPCL